MTRSFWVWARPLAGVGILTVLLWRLGTGPFLAGLREIDAWALAAALGIGALTTVCCAWRWSLVARGLGVRLPLGTAVAHCYRSVFLNATLPGGVLGDVHRAVSHGRDAGDVGRGIRAVVWERTAGQAVQLAMAVVVLTAFPSPVRAYLPAAVAVVVAVGLGAVLLFLLSRAAPRGGLLSRLATGDRFARLPRALRAARADLREGVLARGTWPGIVLASVVVVAGHLATFVIAAYAAGATAPLSRLVPLTLLALLAMGLPVNVGGWGPREGVAAWAFGAAGLTVTQGVATAVAYGVLVLVSSLPGAGVLMLPRIGRVWRSWRTPVVAGRSRVPVAVGQRSPV
ncbi:lysylphosphatidylglycerol synthase transmembrane domain-containing protein [Planosporangium sp. 12N6]|uniref:lysylphosphatidylglycerol synthase transmembrane domain-containing protein n=1 Tax=Planosporangium spinosum TaxID=3402278 RepID=UPI003CEA8397